MPARGQEKSDAERTVYALERRFATPVPKVHDRDELNRHLLHCCLKERARVVRGRSESIGQMFQTEKANAVELPSRPFDACLQQIRQVDKYQTVLFEEVRYSVPRQVAFECVTVKAYMDAIVIVHKGVVVARHHRSRTPGDQVLEPTHYLATLGRKPAYLDETRLFTGWQLPAAFVRLREKFRQLYGDRTGTRHYIRVLQLLASHSVELVLRAIEACEARQMLTAEIITGKLESFRASASVDAPAPHTSDSSVIPHVHVPPPDLRRFDQLLVHHSSQGEKDHVRDAIEAQPQDAEAADHAGRAHAAVT